MSDIPSDKTAQNIGYSLYLYNMELKKKKSSLRLPLVKGLLTENLIAANAKRAHLLKAEDIYYLGRQVIYKKHLQSLMQNIESGVKKAKTLLRKERESSLIEKIKKASKRNENKNSFLPKKEGSKSILERSRQYTSLII